MICGAAGTNRREESPRGQGVPAGRGRDARTQAPGASWRESQPHGAWSTWRGLPRGVRSRRAV